MSQLPVITLNYKSLPESLKEEKFLNLKFPVKFAMISIKEIQI